MRASAEVQLNPPGIEDAYLSGLRAAFGAWGGRAELRWWFRRPVGERVADLLVVVRDGRPVAGTAVSYRRLALDAGPAVRAGVMSGAWTLPEHRGRGCFGTLIEASRDLAHQRGCALLLAMARAGRMSGGPLGRASTARFDTWQLRGPGAARRARVPSRRARPAVRQLAAWFHRDRDGAAFVYPEAGLFAQQARLDRPETRIVDAGDGRWVVAEPRADALRVQAVVREDGAPTPADLAAAIAAARASEPRPITAFTADRAVAEAAASLGFAGLAGNLFVLRLPEGLGRAELPARWSMQELDRA
jgi:hypothetical protein